MSDLEDLAAQAITAWGTTAQWLMVAEEAAELNLAVLKFVNRGAGQTGIIDEMADLEIMLEGARQMIGPSGRAVLGWRKVAKLERLRERLHPALDEESP